MGDTVQDVYEFETLEQIRAMSDTFRIQLVRQLGEHGPLTAPQLAARLGERVHRLYHHLGELERHGLIQVVDTRRKGNLIEQYYSPVARRFRVNPTLFRTEGMSGMQAFFENITGLLDTTADSLHAAITAGTVTATEVENAIVAQVRLRLSPERTVAFRERLDALLNEFCTQQEGEGETEQALLTLLYYPLATVPVKTPETTDTKEKPEQ